MTRPEREPTTYRLRGGHSNHKGNLMQLKLLQHVELSNISDI